MIRFAQIAAEHKKSSLKEGNFKNGVASAYRLEVLKMSKTLEIIYCKMGFHPKSCGISKKITRINITGMSRWVHIQMNINKSRAIKNRLENWNQVSTKTNVPKVYFLNSESNDNSKYLAIKETQKSTLSTTNWRELNTKPDLFNLLHWYSIHYQWIFNGRNKTCAICWGVVSLRHKMKESYIGATLLEWLKLIVLIYNGNMSKFQSKYIMQIPGAIEEAL